MTTEQCAKATSQQQRLVTEQTLHTYQNVVEFHVKRQRKSSKIEATTVRHGLWLWVSNKVSDDSTLHKAHPEQGSIPMHRCATNILSFSFWNLWTDSGARTVPYDRCSESSRRKEASELQNNISLHSLLRLAFPKPLDKSSLLHRGRQRLGETTTRIACRVVVQLWDVHKPSNKQKMEVGNANPATKHPKDLMRNSCPPSQDSERTIHRGDCKHNRCSTRVKIDKAWSCLKSGPPC